MTWLVTGDSFVGEHQRMLDHLWNSDNASAPLGSLDSPECQAHVHRLTALSWLQPRTWGVDALPAVPVCQRSQRSSREAEWQRQAA